MDEVVMEVRALLQVGVGDQKVRRKIRDRLKNLNSVVVDAKKAPIAFGIEALHLLIRAPELEGVSSRIAEAIEGVKGVSSVEVGRMSRV